jgi:hypothetical protein
MPKALEPGIRFPMALKSDQKLPVDTRPVFWVRALASREQLELSELVDSWYENADEFTTKQWYEQHVEFLMKHVEDWDNMIDPSGNSIPYTEENVREWLSYQEIIELVRMFLQNAHLTDMEKKSFELRPVLNNQSSVYAVPINA